MVKIHNKSLILKFLLSNKKEEFTIRAIAKNISVDYKTVYLIIKELIENKIILAKKIGQTVLCSINQKEFNADIFRAELIRKEELLRNKNFYALYDYFKDIEEPFFILLLFGSYVNRKNRKKSDVDIMLISDDKKIKENIKNKISLIPLDIHLLTFTSSEFLSMLKTTKFNVGREAFNNNIILSGIENYYRLIKNA
ncbi:MAG: nucleotidyltransferase domain-containing protein [Candidatus Woesearchaeota archaeon]